jgi:hypothetical protein
MTSIGASNPTSYFSTPETELDPTLFQGRSLRDWVRQGVLHLLYDCLNQSYHHAELWSHAWLAGSGVSYQWSSNREPKDLDCLVGVSFVQFRKANPSYQGLSDAEISNEMNELFRSSLQPQTENWNGYELTFFVNPAATDIRAIKPYAAYDLKYDEWTVYPSPTAAAPTNASWESVVSSDKSLATQISTRYTAALNDVQNTHNSPARRNAEARLAAAGSQGEALYNEIHDNRSNAFSPSGEGYADFHNYRWQAGKREGTIQTLRNIAKRMQAMRASSATNLYGVELPSTDTLIRRAALHNNN